MGIPSSFTVAGHSIDVVLEEDVVEKSSAYGYFSPGKMQIVIDSGLQQSLMEETFWHEVVEVLNFLAEANMEHHSIQVFGLFLHQIIGSALIEEDVAESVKKKTKKTSKAAKKTPQKKRKRKVLPRGS
jgi:hypothetical protein